NTPCGGKGICKKCAVKASGALSEPDTFEKSLGDSTLRLACRATIQGNATVYADSIREYIHYPVLNHTHAYGVAVDIGTTTLQIAFVDMTTDTVLPEITLLNPQRRFGHDVITRISHASNTTIAHKLTQLLVDAVISIITKACQISRAESNIIKSISFSANTVMSYSLLGIDIAPLGMYPYCTPVTIFDSYRNYRPITQKFSEATITILPIVSAFLGGDFVGGLGILPQTGGNSFFFDIGTNGEMAIIKEDGTILATSCAMGPALEGMNISSGMTATEGAITHFMRKNGEITFTSIGTPAGISGTALVDLIAILLDLGVIDKSGKIADTYPQTFTNQIALEYTDSIKALNVLNTITLSQIDIRNVQLAKGASLAASRILLKEAGLTEHDIDTVYIAGAFGKNVNIENFTRLQFIPHFKNARYNAVGNTSLMAAIEALRNKDFIHQLEAIKKRIRAIDLSLHEEFNDVYVKSLGF
ncbi:MAG: ASKHA domain-containing protein, partial [Spirochaetota bacterium]